MKPNNATHFVASATTRSASEQPKSRGIRAVAGALVLCGALLGGTASGQVLFSSYNSAGVLNGVPRGITYFAVKGASSHITQLETYHWNSGKGTPTVGAIHLFNASTYGVLAPIASFQAAGLAGQGGVRNANWVANTNITLQPGTYAVKDDSPSTWSYNSQSLSAGGGFLYVAGSMLSPYSGSGASNCNYFHPDFRPYGGDGPCGTSPVVSLYRPVPTPKFSVTLDYSAGSPLLTWAADAKICSLNYGGTLVLVDDQPYYYADGNSPGSRFAHAQCE
jgi:hypothetical protein